jgi:uncharacterized protein (DUF433 family)
MSSKRTGKTTAKRAAQTIGKARPPAARVRAKSGTFSRKGSTARVVRRSGVMTRPPSRSPRGPGRLVLIEESAAVALGGPARPTVADLVERVMRTRATSSPPGIAVSRSPEQTARILGTGNEVWEVYKTYLEVGRDEARLQRAYHWLTEEQLRAALAYAAEHRAAILERIREDYEYLPEDERPPALV